MKTLSLGNVNANIILDLTKKTSKEITVGLPHSPEIALRQSSNNHRLATGSSSAIAPMIAIIIGVGVIGFGGYTGYGMWQTKVQNDVLREMEASELKAIEEQAQQEKALLDQQRQEEAALAEQQRLEAEAQYAQETPEVEFPQEEIAPSPAQQARQRVETTRSNEPPQRAKQTQNTPPEPTQPEKVSPEQEALKLFGNIMNNAMKNKGQ